VPSDVELVGMTQLLALFAGFEKESRLAENRALKTVGQKSRTLITREVSAELSIPQKPIRSRIKIYTNLLEREVKVWAGTKYPIKYKQIGKRISRFAPAGSSPFVATMRSNHTGLFYRSHKGGAPRTSRVNKTGADLPIKEVTKSIAPEVSRVMPRIVDEQYKRWFADLWWKDLKFRVNRKKRR